MSTQTFRVPGMVVKNPTTLRVVADAIGGRGVFTSQAIQVQPGEPVSLTVQNSLATSSVAVWRR